jgi:hypothetical protein
MDHATTNGTDHTNGNGSNGNGAVQANGASTANGAGHITVHEGDSVRIRVVETGSAAEDRYRLEDVVRLLLEFRGRSTVVLEVKTGGSVVRMDMPFATVDACPELEKRLCDLLGNDNVSMPVATA